MSERFEEIVGRLHQLREELVLRSRKRRTGGSRKKPRAKLTFASPELEAIFNALPIEMRNHALGKETK